MCFFCYNNLAKYCNFKGDKMFGYVLVNKPELRIREFDTYRSYYCGLCHRLKERHGNLGRMTLNYDTTFLVMLLSDLYDTKDEEKCTRCIAHPVKKHCSRTNSITDYCADMCILLTYFKCLDDWNDEKKFGKRVLAKLLERKCKNVENHYPHKVSFVQSKLNELASIESREARHIDEAARVFGELMAEIFVYKDDQWKDDLYKIGFYLGKFIYLLDAYEDLEKDLEEGAYNPFKEICKNDNFDEQVLSLLMMMISECTDAFERLPLIDNVEILRNILYSGVWTKYYNCQASKKGKENGSI